MMHYLRSRRPGVVASLALPLVLFVSVVACSGKSVEGDGADGGDAGADPGSGGNSGSAGSAGHSTGGTSGAQGGSSNAGMGGTGTAGTTAGAGGAASCVFDGKAYAPGDSFPASDECNTCICMPTGQIACTRLACGGNGGGGGSSLTCDEVQAELANELSSIQECGTADECGQVLQGTSCGCTRDLVARLHADTARFYELLSTTVDGETCSSYGSTCDCPEVDGFACQNGMCTWNYVDGRECSPAPVGRLCVLGNPIDSGDLLAVGDPLVVRVFPEGCFSSSCTETVVAECSLMEAGPGEFVAEAEFCLTQDSSGACTSDCSGGGDASCTLKAALVEGQNTIRVGKASLTVTVPGLIKPGDGCLELSDG